MSEWISVEDRLPGIDTIVELKFNESGREYQFSSKLSSLVTLSHMTHWRPIPEKRPDFSRLREGDLIIIEFYENPTFDQVGYFHSFKSWGEETFLYASYYKDISEDINSSNVSLIKKITRINLEEEKFEEI